jgi:hypothetical protein
MVGIEGAVRSALEWRHLGVEQGVRVWQLDSVGSLGSKQFPCAGSRRAPPVTRLGLRDPQVAGGAM